METTEKRVSIVKCGEMLFEGGACENPVGLTMCEGLMKTVFTKRWVPLEIRLVGGDRVAYWLQSCQWLLLSLLSSWSRHYGLYWCMPRKKEREILV